MLKKAFLCFVFCALQPAYSSQQNDFTRLAERLGLSTYKASYSGANLKFPFDKINYLQKNLFIYNDKINMAFIQRLLYEAGFLKFNSDVKKNIFGEVVKDGFGRTVYEHYYTSTNTWDFLKKEIKLENDQKDIIVNLLIRRLWNLRPKDLYSNSNILEPNIDSVIYVKLFKELLSNHIIPKQFDKSLEDTFKLADKAFSKDYWKTHFLSGNSINIEEFKKLKPVDPAPLAKDIKAKKYKNKQDDEIIRELQKKYEDFMGHLRTLGKDDQELMTLFEESGEKQVDFNSVDFYINNVKGKIKKDYLNEFICIINSFEELLELKKEDDFVFQISTFTGRMAHCSTGQAAIINALIQGILPRTDSGSDPVLQALSEIFATYKVGTFQRLVFPLINGGESTAVVQRYQTALKEEVGLVVAETRGANFDNYGINEWDKRSIESPPVNVSLMKSILWGIVFTPRNLAQTLKDHFVNVLNGELKKLRKDEKKKIEQDLEKLKPENFQEFGIQKTENSLENFVSIWHSFYGKIHNRLKENASFEKELSNFGAAIESFGDLLLIDEYKNERKELLTTFNTITRKLTDDERSLTQDENIAIEEFLRDGKFRNKPSPKNKEQEKIETKLQEINNKLLNYRTMNQQTVTKLLPTHITTDYLIDYLNKEYKLDNNKETWTINGNPYTLWKHLTYTYGYNNSFDVQPEKFKKKATGLLRNFLEDWFTPENSNTWQGNFTDEAPYRLLVKTGWIQDNNEKIHLDKQAEQFKKEAKDFLNQMVFLEKEKKRYVQVFEDTESVMNHKYQQFLEEKSDLLQTNPIRPAVLFIQKLHKEMNTQKDAERLLALLTRGQGAGGFIPAQSDHSELATPEEAKIMLSALKAGIERMPKAHKLFSPAQDLLQSYITYNPESKDYDYLGNKKLESPIRNHLEVVWKYGNDYACNIDEKSHHKPVYAYHRQSFNDLIEAY